MCSRLMRLLDQFKFLSDLDRHHQIKTLDIGTINLRSVLALRPRPPGRAQGRPPGRAPGRPPGGAPGRPPGGAPARGSAGGAPAVRRPADGSLSCCMSDVMAVCSMLGDGSVRHYGVAWKKMCTFCSEIMNKNGMIGFVMYGSEMQ